MRVPSTLRRRSRSRRSRVVLLLAALALAVLAAGAGAVLVSARQLPDPDALFVRRVIQSTKIYDRTGEVLLYDIHGEERRTVIPWEEIPAPVKDATVAAEDANFWRHRGVDLRGITRALLVDLASGDLRQGGSTITQQLVKNALVGRERTLNRKIREALMAILLESRYPKEKILEAYLNQIPYGQNAYGIEAAAETYFGKHAKDLSRAEAALLAALPRAPSYYSPYGSHRDELIARQRWTLGRMVELGSVSESQARVAETEPLRFLPAVENIRAPHFALWVRDYLIQRYGEEEVNGGGLLVRTTLDWELQEAAERLVREGAERNESLLRAANMALVAIDPRTGGILAMVGSSGWMSDALSDPMPEGCTPGVNCRLDPYVNAAIRPRQPGSAFKPFVYATAFQKGYEPETVVFDLPTEFDPGCDPEGQPRPASGVKPEDCYHPGNYDQTFRGPVTLRQAIAQSLNVPSVKVLYLAGVESSIRTAEELGISTLKDRSRFGLSLVLGGAEVKLLELVSAYGAFATDGVWNPPVAVARVETPDGLVLEEWRPSPRAVLDPEIARMISSVLSDDDARVPVFRPRSSLYLEGYDVAAKTGTTQDFRDAWTVGYTPSFVAGVWVGNSDNTPLEQHIGSGVMAAAPTWHEFMAVALAATPPEDFPHPARREVSKPVLRGLWQGGVVVALDRISGKLATVHTPPETTIEVAFGDAHDPLHWIDRADPTGPPPADPTSDPQYANWDAAFRRWLETSGFRVRSQSEIPTEPDPIHVPEKVPRVSGVKKSESDDSYVLEILTTAPFPLREVTILEGERILRSERPARSPLTLTLRRDELSSETTVLRVKAYDSVGNVGEATINLR